MKTRILAALALVLGLSLFAAVQGAGAEGYNHRPPKPPCTTEPETTEVETTEVETTESEVETTVPEETVPATTEAPTTTAPPAPTTTVAEAPVPPVVDDTTPPTAPPVTDVVDTTTTLPSTGWSVRNWVIGGLILSALGMIGIVIANLGRRDSY